MMRFFLFFCVLFLCSSCLDFIASGSFSYAEKYEFEINKEELKQCLNDFKVKNGYLVPFTDSAFKEGDFYMDYYTVFFYNPVDSTCFGTLVFDKPNEKNKSYIYLTDLSYLRKYFSTRDPKDIGEIVINHSPEGQGGLEVRRYVINRFEKDILLRLGIPYKSLGNGMGI